jgi:uncharacterized protein YndB with AHSA1/START domain
MNRHAVTCSPDTIQFVRHMYGPISRLWEQLTHPMLRGRWLATGPMELEEGGRVELTFRHDELTSHAEIPPPKHQTRRPPKVSGRMKEWRFQELVDFTWPTEGVDTEVRIEIASLVSQVRLTLTHSGIPSRAAMVDLAAGWHAHLNVLEAKMNGIIPPPFWRTHIQCEKEYEERLPDESVSG